MGRPSKRAAKVRTEAEFDLARLRAQIGTPRDSVVTTSWSLQEIFAARDAQMRGQFAPPARAAASMRTDDALFVAYNNRLDPQRCIQRELVPAGDKGKAVSVAGEAEALFGEEGVGIQNGALADINGCLVNHGVAFGYNVAKPREDGSRIDYEHRYWPIEYVRWDEYLKQYVTRIEPGTSHPLDRVQQDPKLGFIGAYEVPITHGDGRWTIYANHEDKPFRQSAAILPALAVWARHAFALRDWAKGSIAHGNAKFVGEMPEGVALQLADGSLTPEASAMALLLRDLASADSPVGLRPAKSKTDMLTNTSSAWQVWTELVGNGERAAARIYLGTDGTLGSQGGAPGVDITKLMGVAVTKVRGDLGCIERCFTEGVIVPWTAVNFGDSSLAPSLRYMLPDPDEDAWRAATGSRRQAFFADVAAMKANGFVVDQDTLDALAKEYDVTAPKLPDPAPAQPSPGAPQTPTETSLAPLPAS